MKEKSLKWHLEINAMTSILKVTPRHQADGSGTTDHAKAYLT